MDPTQPGSGAWVEGKPGNCVLCGCSRMSVDAA